MSQYLEGAVKTDTAAGAIAAHLRIKTPGALEAAGASDFCLGSMEFACLAAGPASYRVRTAQGTVKMVASGAITKGVTVYAAAAGKISAAGSIVEGRALEAATADGDVIEVLLSTTSGAAASDISTTTASSFTIANGSSEVKLKLDTDSKTGNYTLTVAPTDNLAGNVKVQLPVVDSTLLSSATAVVATTNDANALAVGRAGATNPALKVTGAVATSATGINITPAAAGAGIAVAAISSGANENLTLDAKGTGTITIAGTSTGAVTVTPATTITGALTSNGGIVMGDAKDVTTNNTTGTKIGNHTANKIGFWGVTPVVQQNVIANATNDADNLMAQLNDVLTLLKTTGLMKAA